MQDWLRSAIIGAVRHEQLNALHAARIMTGTATSTSGVYLRWVLANGIAELFGLGGTALAAWAIFGALAESDTPAVLAGALGVVLSGMFFEGVVVGLAQARVLRSVVPEMPAARWVRATTIGAGIAWTLGMIPSTLGSLMSAGSDAPPADIGGAGVYLLAAAMGLVLGPILGAPQWRVLREHRARAGWWIPANALAWCCGMPVIFLATELIGHGTGVVAAIGIAAGACLAAGLVVGAVHGMFLMRILRSDA